MNAALKTKTLNAANSELLQEPVYGLTTSGDGSRKAAHSLALHLVMHGQRLSSATFVAASLLGGP